MLPQRPPRLVSLLLLAFALSGCAAPPPSPSSAVDALLLGEQHDAPDHQRRHRAAIEQLAAQQRLAAVALEMVEQGVSTAGLPASAPESQVRDALRWDDRAWPWSAYGPSVMAAVRSGVPVLGANLPRPGMRAAMADPTLDSLLDSNALERQRKAIRDGHCGLLAPAQIPPMTRIQIARDRAMAQSIAAAQVPGKTVVLIAGAGHVDPDLGVPRHLPPAMRTQAIQHPADPARPATDHCAELRRQLPAAR